MENIIIINLFLAFVAFYIVLKIPTILHSPKTKLINHGITVKDVNFVPINILDIVYDKNNH